MTDSISTPTTAPLLSEQEFERQMQERRAQPRILAFCQIMDLDHNLLGVSFDLTRQGICLSLPNTWPKDETFQLILKRADQPALPQVVLTISPVWRKVRNAQFDEIGARITAVDSPENFETFLGYCDSVGPSGLFEED
ncbi:MAG: hypothetical protein ACK5CA_07015 [Cyanobacteriota bacterium]